MSLINILVAVAQQSEAERNNIRQAQHRFTMLLLTQWPKVRNDNSSCTMHVVSMRRYQSMYYSIWCVGKADVFDVMHCQFSPCNASCGSTIMIPQCYHSYGLTSPSSCQIAGIYILEMQRKHEIPALKRRHKPKHALPQSPALPYGFKIV